MNYYPPWGYGPPPQNNGPSRRELERVAKNAVRDYARTRDLDKNVKRKRKDERKKQSAKVRAQVFTALEIFILGVVLHAPVGAAFNKLMTLLGVQ